MRQNLFNRGPSTLDIRRQGIGNAQLWGVKKIIMGISYRNLREAAKFFFSGLACPLVAPLCPANCLCLCLCLCTCQEDRHKQSELGSQLKKE